MIRRAWAKRSTIAEGWDEGWIDSRVANALEHAIEGVMIEACGPRQWIRLPGRGAPGACAPG